MASLRWGYLYPGFVRSATPVALEAIPQALWFFLPAFIANPMAVVFGGGSPIDGGRSLFDGQRMFGDGKTWRGLIGGTFSGAILGLLLSLPFDLLGSSSSWSYGSPAVAFVSSAALALGALLGDLAGAFVKRRMHLPRGGEATGRDPCGFGGGGLLLALLIPFWFGPG